MKKRFLMLLLMMVLAVAAYPVTGRAEGTDQPELGNTPEIIMNGGNIVSDADGEVYFSEDGIYHFVNEEPQLFCSDDGHYLNILDDAVYYVIKENGKNIVRRRELSSGIYQDIYQSETEIEELYVSSENKLYYLSEGSIYCYSVEDQKLEKGFADQGIRDFFPTAAGYVYSKGQPLKADLYYNGERILSSVSSFYPVQGYLVMVSDGVTWQLKLDSLNNGSSLKGMLEYYNPQDYQIATAYSLKNTDECEYCENQEGNEAGAAVFSSRASGTVSGYSSAPARQKNIVKRARQMMEIQWTPLQNIISWDSESVFEKGKTYTGLPYGQPVNTGGSGKHTFVPWDVSLTEFLAAVNNPQSLMYTSYSTYSARAPYYSNDCSAFVSWAWNLDIRRTTTGLPYNGDAVEAQSVYAAQIGDAMVYPGNHVVLVSDVGYDTNGNIVYIDISEQTPPQTRTTRYGEGGSKTLWDLHYNYLMKGYTLYRLKDKYSVTFTHDCASPLGEFCELCGRPETPAITKVEQTEEKGLTISWSPVSDAWVYGVFRSETQKGTYTWIGSVSATSYTDKNLSAGKTYYYKVYASKYTGIGWVDSDLSAFAKGSLMGATENLKTASGDGTVNLSWSAVSGATAYGVMRSTSPSGSYQWVTSVSSNSYIDSSVEIGRTYYYKVYAAKFVNGKWINSSNSAYQAGTAALSAVSGVKTSPGAGIHAVKVSWSAKAGATAYGIMRATSLNGTYKWVGSVSGTDYTDANLELGKTYYYKVYAAVYRDGNWFNGAMSAGVSGKVDAGPQNLKAVSSEGSALKLSWDKVSGASGYEVYATDGANGTLKLIAIADTNTYTHKNLKPGNVRYYMVRTLYTVDGKSGVGGQSQWVSGTVQVPSVKIQNVEAGISAKTLNITWSAAFGADVYGILRSETQNGTYKWITSVSTTSYTDTGLTAGKTYYYKVYGASLVNGKWVNGATSAAVSGKAQSVSNIGIPKIQTVEADAGTRSAKITWSSVPQANVYGVLRAESANGTYTWITSVNTTNYTDTGLTEGKTYYYKVYAACLVNGSWLNGEMSSAVSGKVPTFALAEPVIQKAEPGAGTNAVKLTWGAVPYAEIYGVMRSESANGSYSWIGAVGSTTYTDVNLNPDKTYYYKVYATRLVNGQWKDGSPSAAVAGKVLGGPSGVAVNAGASTSLKLTWNGVAGASMYAVYRNSGSGYTLAAVVNQTSWEDVGLQVGRNYSYRVQSGASVDGTVGWGASSKAVTGQVKLGVPGQLTGYGNDGIVNLSWSSVPGAQIYGILRSESENGSYGWIGASGGTTYQDRTCQAGKRYYYKVYASTTVGGKEYNGDYSSAVSVAFTELGVDVSYHNGNIDWNQVAKSGVKFAMIRIGYRRNADGVIIEDVCAAQNLKGALDAGLDVGVYFFSTALNETEAQEEAAWTLNYIRKYKITYPVAYDCEGYEKDTSRMYGMTAEQRNNNAVTFLNTVSGAGYTPMMYGSSSGLRNNWNISMLEQNYQVWVAQWPSQVPVYPNVGQTTYNRKYRMWQYTDRGIVPGISGVVDMDVYYY